MKNIMMLFWMMHGAMALASDVTEYAAECKAMVDAMYEMSDSAQPTAKEQAPSKEALMEKVKKEWAEANTQEREIIRQECKEAAEEIRMLMNEAKNS